MFSQKIVITIEKLVFGGEGLGYFNGRPVFVFGVLPGEEVEVVPVKVRKKYIKAKLVKVLQAAAERVEPKEDHYLSCSPWQVIPYDKQLKYKVDLTKENWQYLTGSLPQPEVEIVPSQNIWHYRNKMEFSLTEDKQGRLVYAWHERYLYDQLVEVDKCKLAADRINSCAQQVLQQLQGKLKLEQIKNILLRYSFYEDKCLGVLFVKDKDIAPISVQVEGLVGWQIVYSNPLSPAAVVSEVLLDEGRGFLVEEVAGLFFRYGYHNFFQVNPHTFSCLIQDVLPQVNPGKVGIDLYAGVGVIGQLLAGKFGKIIAVELDQAAAEIAKENAKENNSADKFVSLSGATEKQDLGKILSSAHTVILDPPRGGMHKRVIGQLLSVLPEQIVYISCNPATQARDWQKLRDKYQINFWRFYDFYPHTPHIESVLIMHRR